MRPRKCGSVYVAPIFAEDSLTACDPVELCRLDKRLLMGGTHPSIGHSEVPIDRTATSRSRNTGGISSRRMNSNFLNSVRKAPAVRRCSVSRRYSNKARAFRTAKPRSSRSPTISRGNAPTPNVLTNMSSSAASLCFSSNDWSQLITLVPRNPPVQEFLRPPNELSVLFLRVPPQPLQPIPGCFQVLLHPFSDVLLPALIVRVIRVRRCIPRDVLKYRSHLSIYERSGVIRRPREQHIR